MLKVESVEAKEMLRIYRKYLNGNASYEEIRSANKQLRDLLKTFGIGAVLILPFAPLTLPLIVALSKRLGIDIIPESFYSEEDND